MTDLITKPNLARPDDFYAEFLGKHEGLSKSQSDGLNARLVLILANHIGNEKILTAALNAATKPKNSP